MSINVEEIQYKVENFISSEILSIKNTTVNKCNSKNISDQILKILTSGKYRKYPITDKMKKYFLEKINYIIDNNLEFIFVPSFGGYKHSWTPSYPNSEWAEIFNVKCFLDYLTPIHDLSDQNVSIEYLSKDVIVPLMNNIPKNYVEEYIKDLRKIFDLFNQKQNKVILKFKSSQEDYNVNNLFEKIEKEKIDIINSFDKLSADEQLSKLKKSENNFCWKGVKDFTNASNKERQQAIYDSRIINETFLKIDSRLRGGSANGRPNVIPMLFRNGTGANNEVCLNVCSCNSSKVAFWVGIGILEIRENKIIPRIISKKQFDILKKDLIRINVNITELKSINKNYEYIYVYLGSINF